MREHFCCSGWGVRFPAWLSSISPGALRKALPSLGLRFLTCPTKPAAPPPAAPAQAHLLLPPETPGGHRAPLGQGCPEFWPNTPP